LPCGTKTKLPRVVAQCQAAALGLDESQHQPEQGGFADARLAHDGGLGGRTEVVAEATQHLTVG